MKNSIKKCLTLQCRTKTEKTDQSDRDVYILFNIILGYK